MHADKGPCKQATGGEFRCCVAGWPLPSRPRHRPSSLPGLSLFRRNAAVLDHRRRHHHEGREKEGSIKAGPSIVSISQLPRMGPSDCSTWAALARWGGEDTEHDLDATQRGTVVRAARMDGQAHNAVSHHGRRAETMQRNSETCRLFRAQRWAGTCQERRVQEYPSLAFAKASRG